MGEDHIFLLKYFQNTFCDLFENLLCLWKELIVSLPSLQLQED